MVANHFAVGERVRLCISIPFAPAGRVGTIRRVFVFVPDLYDVQLDSLTGPRLIYGRELEHAATTARHTATRSV